MTKLTFAICTYNRVSRLPPLLAEMSRQSCAIPYEILVVDNNSFDSTRKVVNEIATQDGIPIRYVFEPQQGIAHARNRALDEAMANDYLVFIDDDELPKPGLLDAAVNAIEREGADCAGGKVQVNFDGVTRPSWLDNDLLGFLAEVDHGPEPFWIETEQTPVWTANVAYNMEIFRRNPTLRFDIRYDRKNNIGIGEDLIMFRTLVERGFKIRYAPDMVVSHYVEPRRLQRRYFLRLHFASGYQAALYELPEYPRKLAGVPPFLFAQAGTQLAQTVAVYAKRSPGALRQAMNFTHACGMIAGSFQRNRAGRHL